MILIRSRAPWRMPLSRDSLDNDFDRRLISAVDPPNVVLMRMEFEQSLSDIDPMTKGDTRIMHLVEEPLRRLIIRAVRHELDPP